MDTNTTVFKSSLVPTKIDPLQDVNPNQYLATSFQIEVVHVACFFLILFAIFGRSLWQRRPQATSKVLAKDILRESLKETSALEGNSEETPSKKAK